MKLRYTILLVCCFLFLSGSAVAARADIPVIESRGRILYEDGGHRVILDTGDLEKLALWTGRLQQKTEALRILVMGSQSPQDIQNAQSPQATQDTQETQNTQSTQDIQNAQNIQEGTQ